jgi:hypothetical protein
MAAVREDTFPATVQLGMDNVKTYPAATGGLHTQTQLDPSGGGVVSIVTASFAIRKDLLNVAPESGIRLFWIERNLEFRVGPISDSGDSDMVWTLTCEALT